MKNDIIHFLSEHIEFNKMRGIKKSLIHGLKIINRYIIPVLTVRTFHNITRIYTISCTGIQNNYASIIDEDFHRVCHLTVVND